jgi:peptidoglycan-associated lipoprotein
MLSLKTVRIAACFALAMLMTGCANNKTVGTPDTISADGTNAPVGGGLNVSPGSEEDFQVNVGRRTFFKKNSSKLDSTANETLDKQAAWLAQYPQVQVKIQGFADDPGSESQNVSLSQKRADIVRNYLISRGVSASRVAAKGYGTQRKVRDCSELACKSQNRRVVTNPQNAPAS